MTEVVLRLSHLTKSFGEKKILKNITVAIEKGEKVVILGASGCGKSTLLRCINGLEEIESGEIEFEGQVIISNSKVLPIARQKIGMVFQNYELFPHLTVLKNMTLGPIKSQKRPVKEVENEAKEFLQRVGLTDKMLAYSRELSGGQKQRIAIGRTLLMHPEVILFDEITASLDPEMVREVLKLMTDLAKENRTMLIVTHEMEFAKQIADRILFMDEGEMIEENTPEEFFKTPKTKRAKEFLNIFDYSHLDD